MTLKNMFKNMKREGLVRKIDQYLTIFFEDDLDRRSDINSPSSALGCVRASYYNKKRVPKNPPNARLQRIFGNGHGVHYRIQNYLKNMGLLLMKEIPLFNQSYNIQGHTDGMITLNDNYYVLEIKSINTRAFSELREAKKDHRAQAMVYMFCLEEQRIKLREIYPTKQDMLDDEDARKDFYASLYLHLRDDKFEGGKTRSQKIRKKVKEHLEIDNILFDMQKPIQEMILLYEDKNTQELKDFVVAWDEELLQETLNRFIKSNVYYALGVVPPRECKTKDRYCDFCDECFK